MKAIIVGLGRMGTGLSIRLANQGHQVTVIDSNHESFEGLGKNFKGTRVQGFGFDKDVLEQAKINQVDAVVACTNSDEVNAVVARISKNYYKVPRVIARLYDSEKAEIYRRLGIQTISTTTWGIERATEILTFNRLDSVYEMGDGGDMLVRIEVPPLLVGRAVTYLSTIGEIQVTSISRHNKSFIPSQGTIFEPNDVLYISVLSSSTDKLKKMLDI